MSARGDFPLQNQEIPISKIIHTSIAYLERLFLSTLKSTPASFLTSVRMTENFFISRIIVCKLYAIVRWWQANCIYISKSRNNKNSNGIEAVIRCYYNEIKSTMNRNRLKEYRKSIPDYQSTFHIPENIIDIRVLQDIDRISVFFSSDVKRSIAITQLHTFTIRSEPFYKIILSRARRHEFFHRYFTFLWPTSIPLKEEQILNIIRVIIHSSKMSLYPFETAERLISTFCMLGQFVNLLKSIMEYTLDLDFHIGMINNRTALITFNECYSPFNHVKLKFTQSNIFLTSTCPLYRLPPKNQNGCYSIFEEFEKRISFQEPIFSASRSILSYSFKICEIDILEMLLGIKDTIYYNHLLSYWNMVKHAIFMSTISTLHSCLVCDRHVITDSSISVYVFGLFRYIFTVDPKDGQLYATLDNYGFHIKGMGFYMPIKGTVSAIEKFISYNFKKLSLITNCYYLFGMHTFQLIPSMIPHRNWAMGFSYAPEYVLSVSVTFTHLQFIIQNTINGLIECSKSVASMNFYSFQIGNIEAALKSLMANKSLILFLQLESEFKKHGFLTARDNNKIKIALRPILNVILKLYSNGYWSLKFDKTSYPFFSKNIIIITGNRLTARMSEYMVNLLFDIQRISSLIFQAKSAQKFPLNISKVNTIHDLFAIVKAENYQMMLDFGPFSDIMHESDTSTHYVLYPYLRATPKFHFSSILSLVTDFKYIQTSNSALNSFGAFLGQKFSALSKVFETFGHYKVQDWCVINLSENSSFYIIYKNILTINMVLKHEVTFNAVIPLKGKNSFSLLPLSTFLTIKRFEKSSISCIEIKYTDLIIARDKIEEYFPYLNALLITKVNEIEFTDDNCLHGTALNDITYTIYSNYFTIESISCPQIKEMVSTFNEMKCISLKVKACFFGILMKILISFPIDVKNGIFGLFSAFLLSNIRTTLSWEEMLINTKFEEFPALTIIITVIEFDGRCEIIINKNGIRIQSWDRDQKNVNLNFLLTAIHHSNSNMTKFIPKWFDG
ncbi:hypothetical protein TRFO_28805 [Tritrichomonas foetus]|uniref:Uncharacterized protein n=1 Tax=Tritrichomonas foetus TaxID=1144522 RepID=A0A1J4K1S0_9EUKA|nr:hypothetical protein TRFO_28805 [Tritrichomonas foetus]|eukprot:OHT03684.1 hypothetical protein TRFO_28805 [Tritrichomonas foetus]